MRPAVQSTWRCSQNYLRFTTRALMRHKTGQGVGCWEFGLVLQSRALANTNHQAVKPWHRLKVATSINNCMCWVSAVPSDQVRYATTTQRLVAHLFPVTKRPN
jgi:hypothetical protein